MAACWAGFGCEEGVAAVACGFFTGGVLSAGLGATAMPLSSEDGCGLLFCEPFEPGTSTICGSGSSGGWVWLAAWPGAVLGGAGCAACGTGWPGVLPCSARFGSNCCAWLAPLAPLSAGGATFETNGEGARVM